MEKLKLLFIEAISIGIHNGISEEKKFSLRIAAVDAYWSMLAIGFYSVYSFHNKLFPAAWIHTGMFLMLIIGTYLLKKRKYDIGRIILHQTGLLTTFLTADAVGVNAGYEFYYFTCIVNPFITFTYEEQKKGMILSAISCFILIAQQVVGPGIFLQPLTVPEEDKLIAISFVTCYLLTVFYLARVQIQVAQKKIEERQNEVMRASNLIALGELSAGIAHEINNPLQTLSLNLAVMKEKFPISEFEEHYMTNDNLIRKMGKMVQNLKDLSRDGSTEPLETFSVSKVVDDALTILSKRIISEKVKVYSSVDTEVICKAHLVQITQVMINLLTNAIDAISELDEKWIKIEIEEKGSYIQILVTDSGRGISESVVENMMKPFFTTKREINGTGLGLSISKNILEKNNGSLTYDSSSINTRFIIWLPKEGQSPS